MEDHHMQKQNDGSKPQFHPVTVADTQLNNSSKQLDQTMPIEPEYPNGVILRINGKLDDSRIAGLIKLY
jgi:hypothetical protein